MDKLCLSACTKSKIGLVCLITNKVGVDTKEIAHANKKSKIENLKKKKKGGGGGVLADFQSWQEKSID